MALTEILKDLGQKPLFHVFFLKNDEESTVKIDEVEEIDFGEVKTHLERGESVFITHGEEPNSKFPKSRTDSEHASRTRTRQRAFRRRTLADHGISPTPKNFRA